MQPIERKAHTKGDGSGHRAASHSCRTETQQIRRECQKFKCLHAMCPLPVPRAAKNRQQNMHFLHFQLQVKLGLRETDI